MTKSTISLGTIKGQFFFSSVVEFRSPLLAFQLYQQVRDTYVSLLKQNILSSIPFHSTCRSYPSSYHHSPSRFIPVTGRPKFSLTHPHSPLLYVHLLIFHRLVLNFLLQQTFQRMFQSTSLQSSFSPRYSYTVGGNKYSYT